jgi:hypothetical protein
MFLHNCGALPLGKATMLKHLCTLLSIVVLLASISSSAQEFKQRPAEIQVAAAKVPNTAVEYTQLRRIGLSGETAVANNLVLKRDVGTFTFKSGTFAFVTPVNGKVTGLVFIGNGTFTLAPDQWYEQRSLSVFTKSGRLDEQFSSLVVRFTDGTYDEIKKAAGTSQGTAVGSGELEEIKGALRGQLHYNLDGRILQDVLSTQPGGLFVAFIKGSKYSSKEIFAIDPSGVYGFAPAPSSKEYRLKGFAPQRWSPEEVGFFTWEENLWGNWYVAHFDKEYKTGTATGTQRNREIDMFHHQLSTRIEKSGKISGDATATFAAVNDGLRVAPFDLHQQLRISSVTGQDGEALDFIQEDENSDWGAYVILPKQLAAGEKYTLRVVYAGGHAVTNEGGGNYYPIARHNWYPNTEFSDYATYDLSFRVPRKHKMVATGTFVKEITEGDEAISQWKADVPQAVAGFSLGRFRKEETKLKTSELLITSYANEDQPDFIKEFLARLDGDRLPRQGAERLLMNEAPVTLGNLSTTGLLKRIHAEAEASAQYYSDTLGPPSYNTISVTQQVACNYGQAWPGLVYLPLCAFFDTTIRNQLNMQFASRGYWTIVGPHEMAHQWWGHTVGFHSYRDQWMSEGFADMSAAMFIQRVYGTARFQQFWEDELWSLTQGNDFGNRPIDVGPVTMGYRLQNSRSGQVTTNLIYPKGAFILHMIRMLMWDPRTQDGTFRAMMQDFVKTFANKAASTEDFKAMVEKHMPDSIDLEGNHRLDWFFNQYVYGTALPSYKFEHSFAQTGQGVVLNFKLTQSDVDADFKMLVPLYLELADGNVIRLGSMPILGNKTVEQSVPLPVKDVPKRAMLNYFYDVLAMQDRGAPGQKEGQLKKSK